MESCHISKESEKPTIQEKMGVLFGAVSGILMRYLYETFMEILCNLFPKVSSDSCLISSSIVGGIPTPLGDKFSWRHYSKQANGIQVQVALGHQ